MSVRPLGLSVLLRSISVRSVRDDTPGGVDLGMSDSVWFGQSGLGRSGHMVAGAYYASS